MEIANLVIAIERVRTEIGAGSYPPDGGNAADTTNFMKRAWPRCTAAAPSITPDTALVYWLGGPDGVSGFSGNPTNPLDGGAGNGPFFAFDPTRITAKKQYLPQNDMANSAPYLYFKAVAGAYTGSVQGGTPTAGQNTTSYQILCPGYDGVYGTPDDMNNFSTGDTVGDSN